MQLPVRAGPSPSQGQAPPYHGPPPNVMVSHAMGGPPGMHPGAPPPGMCHPHHMQMMPGEPPHGHLLMRGGGQQGLPPGMGPPMMGPPGGGGGPGPGPPHGHPGLPPGMHHPAGPYWPPHMAPHITLESRIYDMNKRLQQRNELQDQEHVSQWWEAFAREFFDDDARLTLKFTLDGPKRYTIGRTLIPRYFRSIYDGGVKDLHFVIRHPSREIIPRPGLLMLDCDRALMVTEHDKPSYAQVVTEGKLMCEFVPSESDPCPKILHWMFEIRSYHEFIPKHILRCTANNTTAADGRANTSSPLPESLTKDITRQGMTSVTLNYLRLCLILEPMQQLMSQHKQYNDVQHMQYNNWSPRKCLTQTLFQRFQAVEQRNAQRAPPLPHPQGAPPQGGGPLPPMSQPGGMIPPDIETSSLGGGAGGGGAGGAGGGGGSGGRGGGAGTTTTKPRKRSRKGSQSGGTTPTGAKSKKNSASPAPMHVFPPASNVDVMVVGEPSMMGGDGEYGEGDERVISRLENTQFDPSTSGLPPPGHMHHPGGGGGGMGGPPPGGGPLHPMYLGGGGGGGPPGGMMDLGPPHPQHAQMGMWAGTPPGGAGGGGGAPPMPAASMAAMMAAGGRPRSGGTPQTPASRIGTPSLQPMTMNDGLLDHALKGRSSGTPDGTSGL